MNRKITPAPPQEHQIDLSQKDELHERDTLTETEDFFDPITTVDTEPPSSEFDAEKTDPHFTLPAELMMLAQRIQVKIQYTNTGEETLSAHTITPSSPAELPTPIPGDDPLESIDLYYAIKKSPLHQQNIINLAILKNLADEMNRHINCKILRIRNYQDSFEISIVEIEWRAELLKNLLEHLQEFPPLIKVEVALRKYLRNFSFTSIFREYRRQHNRSPSKASFYLQEKSVAINKDITKLYNDCMKVNI